MSWPLNAPSDINRVLDELSPNSCMDFPSSDTADLTVWPSRKPSSFATSGFILMTNWLGETELTTRVAEEMFSVPCILFANFRILSGD